MTDWIPPERTEHGPINERPLRSVPRPADDHWMQVHWYEMPHDDPAFPEVYTYTDAMSYAPGEEVRFHSSTTAPRWSLEIYRDGWRQEPVHHAADLPGAHSETPKDAYKAGCRWPVRHTWRLPADIRAGFYRVVSTCARPTGGRFVQHHFFVVRATPATRSKMLLLLPTGTWTAYNNWGGACHYAGIDGANDDEAAPVLSLERPWVRGTLWLPEGAPRNTTDPNAPMHAAPSYVGQEWSFANNFGLYTQCCGWAQYDRHFAVWAEREGYRFDVATQTDLHYRPEILEGYRCVVIIGHDEYWSAPMRHAMEAFVENGGHAARFGADYIWQIRLEDEGHRQVCYKKTASTRDPVRNTADSRLLTTAWEAPEVDWPGATTFGVNGVEGIYHAWGGFMPRGQRGFTVYRPEHWAFRDTGLSYGDLFGASASIISYEVDGLDYTFRDGLPYPTDRGGGGDHIKILAMAPATLAEEPHHGEGVRRWVGDADLIGIAGLISGTDAAALDKHRYGSAMLVHMAKGKGEVVTGATCEWVMGLKRQDPFTQQITRNVLNRFIRD